MGTHPIFESDFDCLTEMSGVKIGARVTVPSKNVGVGTIAFIGETKFAKGEWIGLILDEKKGKNNGSIQGVEYFSCEPEFGMFVRPGLIELQGTPPSSTGTSRKSGITKPSGGLVKPTARTSIAGASDRRKSVKETSKAARSRSSSQNRSKVSSAKPSRDPSPKPTSVSPEKNLPETTNVETASKETPLSPVQENKPSPGGGIQNSFELTNQIKVLQREKEELAKEVKDWQERTESLVVKRRQDRENLKDAERSRIQLQQLEEFKGRIMEQHNDLKKELREERKRREDLADEFDAFREDMGEASETI